MENQQRPDKESFFRTLPGILTGIAAVITAIGGLLGALVLAGVLGGDGSTTTTSSRENPITTHSQPQGETSLPTDIRQLPMQQELSAHVWISQGGGTQILDTDRYAFRVGVSHVEDIPPAGESITIFSFDLSDTAESSFVGAQLELNVTDVVGDPFADFGALVIEEVSLGDLSQVLAAPTIREISRITAPTSEPLLLDDEVRDALRRGASRLQLRFLFAGVHLPDVDAEVAAGDSYLEWSGGPTLSTTTRP